MSDSMTSNQIMELRRPVVAKINRMLFSDRACLSGKSGQGKFSDRVRSGRLSRLVAEAARLWEAYQKALGAEHRKVESA